MEPISPSSKELALKHYVLIYAARLLNLVPLMPSESTSLFTGEDQYRGGERKAA